MYSSYSSYVLLCFAGLLRILGGLLILAIEENRLQAWADCLVTPVGNMDTPAGEQDEKHESFAL